MLESFEGMLPASRPSDGPGEGYKFYCTLFDDMIYKGLCLIRRRELNGKDGFSCAGCSKDIIINSVCRRRLALQAQS